MGFDRGEEYKELKARLGKVHSPSSISSFTNCPRKFYYKWIMRLPEAPSKHLVMGKLMHSIVEEYINKKLTTEDELLALFDSEWVQPRELGMSDDDWAKETKKFRKRLGKWYKLTATSLPDEIETEAHLISTELEFHGFADRIEVNDGVHIYDLKTSASDEIKDGYKFQLLCYKLMVQENLDSTESVYVYLDFLEKGIKVVNHTQEDIDITKKKILSTKEAISKAGKELKNFKRGFHFCSNCSYKERCFNEG